MVPRGLLSGRICSLPPAQVPRVLPVSHHSILFRGPPCFRCCLAVPGAEGRSSGRPYSPLLTSLPPSKLVWTPSYLCAAFLSWDLLGWKIHLPLLRHCDFVILIEIKPCLGALTEYNQLLWSPLLRCLQHSKRYCVQPLNYGLPGNWSISPLTHIYQGLIMCGVRMRLQWTKSNCPCLHGPLWSSVMYYNWFVGVILSPHLVC